MSNKNKKLGLGIAAVAVAGAGLVYAAQKTSQQKKLSFSEKQACLKEATESTDWVYDTIRQICGGNTL